jgi:hypothetical protein
MCGIEYSPLANHIALVKPKRCVLFRNKFKCLMIQQIMCMMVNTLYNNSSAETQNLFLIVFPEEYTCGDSVTIGKRMC